MSDVCLPDKQEWNRRCDLLHHLRTSRLDNVPCGFLLTPRPGTRPRWRLVADYDITFQVVLRQISPIALSRHGFVFLVGLAAFLAALASLMDTDLAWLWTLPLTLVESTPASFTSTPWLEALYQ